MIYTHHGVAHAFTQGYDEYFNKGRHFIFLLIDVDN